MQSTQIIGLNPRMENHRQDAGSRDGGKIADRIAGGLRLPVESLSEQIHRGDWIFDLQSPVRCTDPEKAAALFGRYGIGFRKPPEQLHYSLIQRVLPDFRKADLIDLESVLFGGGRKWIEKIQNKIVNQGLDSVNDVYLGAATQITAWYVGLIKTTHTYVAGDTAAQIGGSNGWTESQDYSESTRQAWTVNGASSSQSVSNSSSRATFSINATITFLGGFLISNSTKGGTTGKIYSEADFSASRAAVSGDSLLVTATFTQASST